MNTIAPSASNRRLWRRAWLPVPFLLLVIAVLWAADSSAAYEPSHLLMVLNLLFSVPGALLVAYQAGRGFLLRGNLGLLGFGCGMLFWGSAGPVGGILVSYGPGMAVTAYNLLVWLAALCHTAGVILAPWQRTAPRWPELWLAGAYAGALTLVAVVVLETLAGAIPTFFIQGQGGTLLRQLVLGSTVALFLLTAILLKRNPHATPSAFQDWYALALLLIAVGLFGVMIQSAVGSALGWTGRIAQYLGGVYLLVAAFAGLRETRDRGHPLEAALGEARQRFEELIALASDGIVVHEQVSATVRGNFLQVNPALCALLGYTAQEMRALTPLDIIAPEEREQIAGDVEVMNRDGFLRHEKTLIAKDGQRIPVEISKRQYQHQGRTLVISVIRDITERKQAEAALRANEATLNGILDATHEFIWLFSAEGIVLKANATALTRFGKLASEVVGKRFIEVLPAKLAQSRMARLQEAVEQGRPVEFEDERAGIHFRHSFYPVLDAAGSVIAIASFSRDITAQKQAEAAIRESEQFKQAVLDAVTAHVAVLDRDGVIIAVNEPWRRFAADHAGEAGRPTPNTGIGAHYLAICRAACGESAEGALEAHDGIAAVLAGKVKKFSLEYLCHSLQAKRWFSLTVTPLGTVGGGAVVSHTDITAFRQLANQLRDERDRFAKIVATAPGVICSFRLGPDGSVCFPYASRAIEDLYGLRPEELAESAAPLRALINPDDLSHLDAGIAASAQTMTSWRDEFRVEHPLKGEIWVEGHSMPVREPDGGILWHGYVQDITERKQAERQLFATHERLQALMEALPVGVSFSDDVTCQHVTGNRTLLDQFEMNPQDNVSASAPETMAAGRQVRYFHQGRELHADELPLQRAVMERRVIPPRWNWRFICRAAGVGWPRSLAPLCTTPRPRSSVVSRSSRTLPNASGPRQHCEWRWTRRRCCCAKCITGSRITSPPLSTCWSCSESAYSGHIRPLIPMAFGHPFQ